MSSSNPLHGGSGAAVERIERALRMVERLHYGYDPDAESYGLWDPDTERFVAHVDRLVTDLCPTRAKLIAEALDA